MKRIPTRQEINRADLSKQDIFLQVLDEKRTFAYLSVLLYVSAPHGMELRAANVQINQSWLAWLTYRDVWLEGVSATGVLTVKKMILVEYRRDVFLLSSAEDSATLPSRCIKLVLFGVSRFYTFTLLVFFHYSVKMYQNTVIYFLFGNAAWPLSLQEHCHVKVCDDGVTRKLHICTSERC